MKEELLKIFESAKKAADAAVEDAAEESRCLDALKQLKKTPVTMEFLIETKIGKELRPMTKHPKKNIKAVASDVFAMWKKIVMDGTSKNNDNGNSEPTTPRADSTKEPNVKIEKFSQTETTKVQRSVSNGMIKTEKTEKFSRSEATFKVENGRDVEMKEVKMEKQNTTVQRSQASNGPPKLTSMVKCNDSIRDKVRELLGEAFTRVSSEADEYESTQVKTCDPIRAAVTVESVLFEKLGRSNGTQKSKYRSIMFNIRDPKNPDLRRRLLTGEVKPEKLVTMSVEEMASDQRKQENNQIREKTLFDCERAGAPKASTDQFKCGRCGQRKTTYYQLQTRSADEPMTTFVTCVNCNNHWKFC